MRKNLASKNPIRGLALAAVAAISLTAGPALAAGTIVWLGFNFPHDLSADGSAAAGNTGPEYDAFRWTADVGVVNLGMSTTTVFGQGGGTPDISDDGLSVSATVITPDSTAITMGVWTKGIGWQFAIPPVPPEGGLLSGNGKVLTGYFWRPGNAATGLAHAFSWSTVLGFTHLPTPLKNCRGNDANYDGSVVVGWSERFDGVWCPTVWENGAVTQLELSEAFCQADGVSGDGNTVWGQSYNPDTQLREAALWNRTAGGWQLARLGTLPGTFVTDGEAMLKDMSGDETIGVGMNVFSRYSIGAFVWTLEQGMVEAGDWFASEGVDFPAGFLISDLTAISHDGRVICGSGYYPAVFPPQYEGFIVTRDPVSAAPQVAMTGGVTIEANHPNPFNPSTSIALALDQGRDVRLEIYDARGRLVRVLHDGALSAGRHELVWDGRDGTGRSAASGVYLARVAGQDGPGASHRMTLVK
jgi:hypothetical protein